MSVEFIGIEFLKLCRLFYPSVELFVRLLDWFYYFIIIPMSVFVPLSIWTTVVSQAVLACGLGNSCRWHWP